MITRRHGFKHQAVKAGPYVHQLPPPLCFTVPAQSHVYYPGVPAGALEGKGAQQLNMCKPHLMMDPSDPSTWQRHYRFT